MLSVNFVKQVRCKVRNSVVVTATCHRLGGLVFEPGLCKRFSVLHIPVDRPWVSPDIFPGGGEVKRRDRDVDRTPPPSVEVEKG
jgi:hypothetical protein